jgi:Ca-activated chloride channel homolog
MMLQKTIIILICLLSVWSLQSQIVFEKKSHDFGELTEESTFFVDIKLTNTGSKKEYFLSVRKPDELHFLISGQSILPDSSVFIRLQPKLKTKGKFNLQAEIYTSDRQEATKISIQGNIKSFPDNNLAAFQQCPDFKVRPSQSAIDFKLTVVCIDAESKEPIQAASVFVLQNGKNIGKLTTNLQGKSTAKIPLGFTYFFASHPEYTSSELGSYVNFQRNYIEIELEKKKELVNSTPRFTASSDKYFPPNDEKTIVLEEESKLANSELSSLLEIAKTDSLAQNPDSMDDFNSSYFLPINVIFVLDISNSMKKDNRIELMKYSLYQLADFLRKKDFMGVVTYADQAKILISPTSGDKKTHLKEPIEKLRIGGATSGGDGIKMAYKEIKKNYLAEGKNLIIVITDGAFNKSSTDFQFIEEENEKHQIELTVVGIQADERATQSMKLVSTAGKGRFISIDNLEDAHSKLIREVKEVCFIRK